MDQINNPIFKETKRRLNITHDIIARRTEELRLKWEGLNETLEVWSKNNGKSLSDTYELFIKDNKLWKKALSHTKHKSLILGKSDHTFSNNNSRQQAIDSICHWLF